MLESASHQSPCEQKLKRIETEYQEFVSVLAHDFAGPFRHLIGFSNLIMRKNETSFDEETSTLFKFIHEAGINGKDMLDHLTAYARLTDDVAPPISNNSFEMITDILEDLKDLILENNTHIEMGSLPTVMASPDLLRMSFFHVIKNAIMYSNKAPRPEIQIRAVSTPTQVTFNVIDNGIGMTDHQISKVFLVLKRAVAPPEYEGDGMGLAIVKKAVEYHNGAVNIDGNPDNGTKVSISFPVI